MMLRIIPRLDIKGPNLVKGIHLEGLRVIGDPAQFAYDYYEQGADELFYQDVVASLYNRNAIVEFVRRTSEHIFIPLTVGGGIRSVADIYRMLNAGADKVCINTEAVRRPSFITEAARQFGSQAIVIAIETIYDPDTDQYRVFTDNGRQSTGLNAATWIQQVVDLGAGEILLTSVDQEGTQKGFDLKLLQSMPHVSVPVVLHGGAGSIADVVAAAKQPVEGLAIASLLHYQHCNIQKLKLALEQHQISQRVL